MEQILTWNFTHFCRLCCNLFRSWSTSIWYFALYLFAQQPQSQQMEAVSQIVIRGLQVHVNLRCTWSGNVFLLCCRDLACFQVLFWGAIRTQTLKPVCSLFHSYLLVRWSKIDPEPIYCIAHNRKCISKWICCRGGGGGERGGIQEWNLHWHLRRPSFS